MCRMPSQTLYCRYFYGRTIKFSVQIVEVGKNLGTKNVYGPECLQCNVVNIQILWNLIPSTIN